MMVLRSQWKEFKATFGYAVSLRPAWVHDRQDTIMWGVIT